MEKQKALDMALSQIEKQFGKGAVMKLGEKSVNQSIEVISTGCLELDFALGVGGLDVYKRQGQRRYAVPYQHYAQTRPRSRRFCFRS